MPVYEYLDDQGQVHEHMCSYADRPDYIYTANGKARLIMSAAALDFKGGGFDTNTRKPWKFLPKDKMVRESGLDRDIKRNRQHEEAKLDKKYFKAAEEAYHEVIRS